MCLTIRLTEVRHPGWVSKDYFDRTKMHGHQRLHSSSVLFCHKRQQQQEIETLTWSAASHSDRFLQGRVEFSFISHVPSRVQNRYTCPCSTARSKTSHGVNGRTCPRGKGHRAAWDSVQPFFPTDHSPGWRRKTWCCWGSTPPAPCLQQTLLLLILRARKQLGRTWLQRDQMTHTPGPLLTIQQQQCEIVAAISVWNLQHA